eukprot:959734_1
MKFFGKEIPNWVWVLGILCCSAALCGGGFLAYKKVYPTVTKPGQPTNITVTPGDQKLTIEFTPPASDGGRRIDHYTLETTSDGKTKLTPTGSPFEIPGLTNGKRYTYHLKAHNAMGDSIPTVITGTPGTKPGEPTDIIVTPGDKKLTIHFTRLESDGGYTIDRYTVETTGGQTKLTPTRSPFEIPGLTNGEDYTYFLKAQNAMGVGTRVEISGTPGTKPGEPTDIIVTPGDKKLTIHFTRLESDGGYTIDRYTVETTGGQTKLTPTRSPFEIPGLTN